MESDQTAPRSFPSFHVVAKPVGSLCNLDCAYCFYLEKENLYAGTKFRMNEPVLEEFVKQYIQGQQADEVHFLWQGGEPTLLGVDYFRRALTFQDRYSNGKRIHNAMQTNGVLIDESWCRFFAENDFLIGVSIDGPAELHDPYRVTKGGEPTHERVVQGIRRLLDAGVTFNTLTAVHPDNQNHPLEVYDFLKQIGSTHLQFLPIVERWVDQTNGLASPATTDDSRVTPWTVDAAAFGDFLIAIFDRWFAGDVGQTFVQQFDTALESWLGLEPALCLFRKECGNALAIERNGDVYACDHFVFPEFHRGNIMESNLVQLTESTEQKDFGQSKRTSLPRQCLDCDVLFACNGECPKNRFMQTSDGESGLNYLCEGYQRFFRHIDPAMKRMAQSLRQGVIG